jgi:thiol-disulfide isomerase/thioredoxin
MEHRILTVAAILVALGAVAPRSTDAATSEPAVIRISTSEGTLVARVDDPKVSVQVEGSVIVVTGAGFKELRLQPGDFNAQTSDGGTPVVGTVVTITRGQKEILNLRREGASNESTPTAGSPKLPQGTAAAEAHPASKRLLNPKTGHDYQRIDVPMTWQEAKEYCEQLGGYLATATTAEENEFIYTQFGTEHVCWLGATDEGEEGTWKWITDEPWDYENWHPGEPSNNDGTENYLVLGNTPSVRANGTSYFYRFGPRWNDHVATGEYHGTSIAYAVCEWDEHDPQKAVEVSPVLNEMTSLQNLQRLIMTGLSGDELINTATEHIQAFPDSPRNRAVAQMLIHSLTRGQEEQESIGALQKLTESEITQLAEAANERIQQLEMMLELKKEPLKLTFTAVDGRAFDIEEYRGKVVLVDFWATWCGPCVAGMPELIDLYKTHHEQGFEIVGISFDSDKESLEKFVAEHEMPWVQFFDGKSWDNEYGRLYGIRAIPTMWLIGRDGKVVDFAARMNLSEKVEQLLEE